MSGYDPTTCKARNVTTITVQHQPSFINHAIYVAVSVNSVFSSKGRFASTSVQK